MPDWIVIGGGITGISLGYELQKAGFSVLLIEQNQQLQGGSSLGYGGISYWAGTTPMTQQLAQEGIALQRSLSDELGSSTEFRELDLLLTLEPDANRDEVLKQYTKCAITPTFLTAQESFEREPLLDRDNIGGALLLPHAHINLDRFVAAHSQAFQQLGGEIIYTQVHKLLVTGDRVTAIRTEQGDFTSEKVAICAGGLSRFLLKESAIEAKVYFTHAEAIDIEPVDFELRSMVMPADTKRYALEAETSNPKNETLWNVDGNELLPPSVDAGAIQFSDRRIRIGQLSRVLTDPRAAINPVRSEADIRTAVTSILPKIANLRGKWRNCLVAFSGDNLPLVGALRGYANLNLFTGFTNPTLYVPPLSRRFAKYAKGEPDPIIDDLSPQRFAIT
ncbi:MAG: FAD-dependent oxidoreductase [Oscillatoriales cyanobacterium CG2_30_44_21]|nr:MAG: FAD-dependent oxidoreductase [Oscillatoriales cyanobacterium CG2_30_44_21]